MVTNPLESDIEVQVRKLISYAKESVSVVPKRLTEAVQDIVDTLSAYVDSDEDEWAEYRVAVPFEYVNGEFRNRLNLWRQNKTVAFQDDDAPKLSMAERAVGTLSEGGYVASIIAGQSGIHVKKEADKAIAYLDDHFLAHPYSALKGEDDSVVFTILDSGYYPPNSYERTANGTNVLTVDELAQGLVLFAERNPVYADHLRRILGDMSSTKVFHAEEFAADEEGIGGFGGAGFGGKPLEIEVTPAPTPTPPTPTPTTPTPTPTTPSPAPTTANPYEGKKVIPAKRVTTLPAEFLEKVREAAADLHPDLSSQGSVDPMLTQFFGIEPCPPCHLHIPAESEDEVGQCVDMCEEDESCVNGKCEKYQDPPCKPTMRVNIDKDDRMCRIDVMNEVIADASNDDGFAWRIHGQPQTYSTVVFDRTVPIGSTPLTKIAKEKVDSNQEQNFTSGSAHPKPRKVSPFLMNGVGYRLPCPTADATPVKVHVTDSPTNMRRPTNFQFYKDSADNLYLECTDLGVGESYDGTFIVELQYPTGVNQTDIDKTSLYGLKDTFAELAKKAASNPDLIPKMPALDARAVAAADLVLNHISKKKKEVYTKDSVIGELLVDLCCKWLYNFTCDEIPRQQLGISTTQLYLNTEAGACRHRAYLAFLALNRLGLPTRFCGSTCHAWPEIWDYEARKWVQIDLGGCGGSEPAKGCPPCTKPNPLYGLQPDEPKCLPVECPEHHYCDPEYDRCIPNCASLYPDDPDYHFNPKSGLCEKCPDGRVWNPALEVCECDDCPEGFTMEEGKCVDSDGELSEEAPLGYYPDTISGLCLPIPDCENERPGSVFDIETGQCICQDGPNPLDPEAPHIPYSWSDEQGKCIPEYAAVCGENEYWDAVDMRCRPIPESLRKIIEGVTGNVIAEDEVVEGLIVEEGQARIARTGLVNPVSGELIYDDEMEQQGFTPDDMRGRGYTESWESVKVSRAGLRQIPISNTLHGIHEWVSKQDGDFKGGKVQARKMWEYATPKYRLIFEPVEGSDIDFTTWGDAWKEQIENAFAKQFTVTVSDFEGSPLMIVNDLRAKD